MGSINRRKIHVVVLLGILSAIAGCSKGKKIFLPGKDFYQKVELIIDRTEVKVGETLYLKVTRSTDG